VIYFRKTGVMNVSTVVINDNNYTNLTLSERFAQFWCAAL